MSKHNCKRYLFNKLKALYKKVLTRLKLIFNKVKYYTFDIVFWSINIILFLQYQKVMIFVFLGYLIGYILLNVFLYVNSIRVTSYLSKNNVHMFGYRRKGKDLAIQHYIIRRFKKRYEKICKREKLDTPVKITNYFNENPLYLTLYNYGYGGKIVDIKEFELRNTDNTFITYKDFIEGKPVKANKLKHYEGLDLILGEAQLALPNTEHNTLDRVYPWLPVFIALSGHLYNMNILINSQEYSRVWIKLRGQQDNYMRAVKTFPVNKSVFARIYKYIPGLRSNLYTKVRIFEEQQSAENNVLPFKAVGAVNEAGKTIYLTSGQATKEQFEATNGKIFDVWIKTPRKYIKYDTRAFHEVIFGEKFDSSY